MTRFYLPSTGAAAVSPAYGGWGETASADRRKMVSAKISSAMTNKSGSAIFVNKTSLVRQFVSNPLAAQTISGTVKSYIRGLHAPSGTDICVSRLLIRVCSNDGTTFTGTLLSLSGYGGNNNWNTSLRNVDFADGDALTSVTVNDGDRLVVEVGGFLTIDTGDTVTLNFGDDSGTDLAENETGTAANNPWIEFSGTISFQPQTVIGSQPAFGLGKRNATASLPAFAPSIQAFTGSQPAIGMSKIGVSGAQTGFVRSAGADTIQQPVYLGGAAFPVSGSLPSFAYGLGTLAAQQAAYTMVVTDFLASVPLFAGGEAEVFVAAIPAYGVVHLSPVGTQPAYGVVRQQMVSAQAAYAPVGAIVATQGMMVRSFPALTVTPNVVAQQYKPVQAVEITL